MSRLFRRLLGSSTGQSVEVGTVADVPRHLRRLREAPPGGFLILEVAGLDGAFLQFSAGPDVIQMDLALIQEVQVSPEQRFRVACESIRRPAYESAGSDGSRFLDCDLSGDPMAAATDVRRVVESLFEVNDATELKFVGVGLPPTAGRRPHPGVRDARGRGDGPSAPRSEV
jgi:hypothetical protein